MDSPPRSTSLDWPTISFEPFQVHLDSAGGGLLAQVSTLVPSGQAHSDYSKSQRAREKGFGRVTGDVVKPCYSRWRHER